MRHVYVLNTCDEWKSYSSFHLYGIWASSKAGTRRLVNAIIEGIKKNYFSYEDSIWIERNKKKVCVKTQKQTAIPSLIFCKTNWFMEQLVCLRLGNITLITI